MLGVGSLVAGLLIGVQFRSAQQLRSGLPTRRVEELAVLVAQAEAARRGLEAELNHLRRRLQEYEALVAEGKALGSAVAQEVAHQRMVLGLLPVRGPGIEVEVTVGPRVPPGVAAPPLQALELAGLVNELWASGAEAVAVNGRRVLARSAFRQSGSRILVDGFPTSPPYVISAIGDAELMEAALRTPGGFADGLRSVGVVIRVRRVALLRLPAYTGPLTLRWARPAE